MSLSPGSLYLCLLLVFFSSTHCSPSPSTAPAPAPPVSPPPPPPPSPSPSLSPPAPVVVERSFHVDYTSLIQPSLYTQFLCVAHSLNDFELPDFASIGSWGKTVSLGIPKSILSLDTPVNVTATVYATGDGFLMALYATARQTAPVAQVEVPSSSCAGSHSISYTTEEGQSDFYISFELSNRNSTADVLLLDPKITFSAVTDSVAFITPSLLNRHCGTHELHLVGSIDPRHHYRVHLDANNIFECENGVCVVQVPEGVDSTVAHVSQGGTIVYSQTLYIAEPEPAYISVSGQISLSPGERFQLFVRAFEIEGFAPIGDVYKDFLHVFFEGSFGGEQLRVSPVFPPTLRSRTNDILIFELQLPSNADVDSVATVLVNYDLGCDMEAGTIVVVPQNVSSTVHVQEVVLQFSSRGEIIPSPSFCPGEMSNFAPFGITEVSLLGAFSNTIPFGQVLGFTEVIIDSISLEVFYTGSISLELSLKTSPGSPLRTSSLFELPAHPSCFLSDMFEWNLSQTNTKITEDTVLSAKFVCQFEGCACLRPKAILRFHFPPTEFQGYIPLTRLFNDCDVNTVHIHGFDIDTTAVRVEVQGESINSDCHVSNGMTICGLPQISEPVVDIELIDESSNEVLYSREIFLFAFPAILDPDVSLSPLQVSTLSFDLGAERLDVHPDFMFSFFSIWFQRADVKVLTQTTKAFPPMISKSLKGNFFDMTFSLPNLTGGVSSTTVSAVLPHSCEKEVFKVYLNSPPSPTPSPTPTISSGAPTSVSSSPTPSTPTTPTPSSGPLDKNGSSAFLNFLSKNFTLVLIAGLTVLCLIVIACFLVCLLCRKKGVRSDMKYQSLHQSGGRKLTIVPADLRLSEEIGRGAFGIVYRGKWRGVEVAIKKMVNVADMEDVEALFQESETMMSLRHPHIISYLGTSADRDTVYIVTAFASLGSFKTILRNKRYVMEEVHLYNFVSQVARGMDYLHTQGLIHRDLKSDNVLVDAQWTLKVADFGLSKYLKDEKEHTMTAVGTPIWAAPEILRREKYSLKADVYSFAIVIWEVIVRDKPYRSEKGNQYELIYKIVMKAKRPPLPEGPTPLVELCERCWKSDPEARPSFSEICAELDLLDNEPPASPPVLLSDEDKEEWIKRGSERAITSDPGLQEVASHGDEEGEGSEWSENEKVGKDEEIRGIKSSKEREEKEVGEETQ